MAVHEMESFPARRKMGYARQENARVAMQDNRLFSELDSTPYELLSASSQDHLRCSMVNSANSALVTNEQICQLQTEMETKTKQLKAAELRAERCQDEATQSDIMVTTLTEEISDLREELAFKTTVGKRAEQQRNQALENAEKLKEAFQEYKANVAVKFQKVMENEVQLKENLTECSQEKEELLLRCAALHREKADKNNTISQLKEDVKQRKMAASENSDLRAQLEDAGRRSADLCRQLTERGEECRELVSLRRQMEDLRALTKNQELCLDQSRKTALQCQSETASLEAILALLHLREDASGPLCARPCMLPPVDHARTVHMFQLKPGEGYQQLLQVLQAKEAEVTKQSGLVQRLQDHMSRAQEEILSLKASLAQNSSNYQNLQTELMDKANRVTASEKELKRKSARVAALEKQLQEKTSAYSQAALKNTELETQLQENISTLQHYQTVLNKKQKEYQQALEMSKQSQSQQCIEQKHRLDLLQLSLDEATLRVVEMQQELSSLQRERDQAQGDCLKLQSTVQQVTQEKQIEVRHNEELLQSLKEQAANAATKECELQSTLSTCREELSWHLQQMEEMKKNFESELQRSKDKVFSQQETLNGVSRVAQSSNEQNLQLQLSLRQQQTMLTEGTARIAELEENQSQLQQQVSTLEIQLQRAQTSLLDEASANKDKDNSLHEVKEKNLQISEMLNQATTDVKKYQVELLSKESELQSLRKDVTIKTSQIIVMDKNLQQTRTMLENKNDLVVELEEKLHRCEADNRNSVQKVQLLEEQLHTVQEELAETITQLHLLKDVLQRTQSMADERQTEVEKLSIRLSETQRELEVRTHEVLDMDVALNERQGELQRRAAMLVQLNVAIQEHKQDMEIKVKTLEHNLEAKEEELREAQKDLGHTKDTHQQSLETLLQQLEDAQHHCRALSTQLDDIKLQEGDLGVKLHQAEGELLLKETRWQQSEASLRNAVTSLEQKLEVEREQHDKELESLQHNRGQLLKMSSHMSSTQEKLTSKLQQQEIQLEQTKMELDCAKAQVTHVRSQLEESRNGLLLTQTQLEKVKAQNDELQIQLKEARVQPVQLQTPLGSPQGSVEISSESIKTNPETAILTSLPSSVSDAGLERLLQSCRDDLSLDLPPSLKATMREALNQQPWDSSRSDAIDHSWRGLGSTEPTSSCEVSFDPLTYSATDDSNVERAVASGGDDQRLNSLKGMLELVTRTLANQEKLSSLTGSGHDLQMDAQ
ncbi:coiled-coil domain-containing protein 18 [Stigmatopora nigra]